MNGFPTIRMRRLRRTAGLRRLVAEARLHPSQFIWPLFIKTGGDATPIPAMPGVSQHPLKDAGDLARRAADLGFGGVLLFGLPDHKDDKGSGAWHGKVVVQSFGCLPNPLLLQPLFDRCEIVVFGNKVDGTLLLGPLLVEPGGDVLHTGLIPAAVADQHDSTESMRLQ